MLWGEGGKEGMFVSMKQPRSIKWFGEKVLVCGNTMENKYFSVLVAVIPDNTVPQSCSLA